MGSRPAYHKSSIINRFEPNILKLLKSWWDYFSGPLMSIGQAGYTVVSKPLMFQRSGVESRWKRKIIFRANSDLACMWGTFGMPVVFALFSLNMGFSFIHVYQPQTSLIPSQSGLFSQCAKCIKRHCILFVWIWMLLYYCRKNPCLDFLIFDIINFINII